MAMSVTIVPLLQDNYGYLVIDRGENVAGVVDPVEPKKVLAAAQEEHVQIVCILTTHHHYDHAGGNKELKKELPDVKVYGGKGDGAAGVTNEVAHGDTFHIGKLSVEVLQTPCHTQGHVCYHVQESNKPRTGVVFTGDTLFVAGCGRFFEGTAKEMYEALVKKLCMLPPETKVYPGHEYTVRNLQFAQTVEPDNHHIQEKLKWARDQRRANKPTVPSTIASELLTNPFVRVDQPAVMACAKAEHPIEVMAHIRALKDRF